MMRLIGRGALRRLALVILGMAVAAQLALAGTVGAGSGQAGGAVPAPAGAGATTGVIHVFDIAVAAS